jgi:hypothetical protein
MAAIFWPLTERTGKPHFHHNNFSFSVTCLALAMSKLKAVASFAMHDNDALIQQIAMSNPELH